jgi:hypothetical protein
VRAGVTDIGGCRGSVPPDSPARVAGVLILFRGYVSSVGYTWGDGECNTTSLSSETA